MGYYKNASQKFAENYVDLHNEASSVGHFLRSRRNIISKLLDPIPPGKIIDVGCGPGMMIENIISKDHEYYGIDISQAIISECSKRAKNHKTAHLSVATMEKLPYKDGFFDTVLCMGAIEYAADIHTAMEELRRVLKPDGVFILTMLNTYSPYRAYLNYRSPNPTYINLLTKRSFRRLFLEHGLTVTNILPYDYNIFLPPFDEKFPRLRKFTTHAIEKFFPTLLQFLATGYIAYARKK